MSNIIISLILGTLSLHFFTLTYRMTSINRAVFNIPISIFEASIPNIYIEFIDQKEYIYFDKDKLENTLTYYFNNSISRYCYSYNMELYYYNPEDESICLSYNCTAVEVKISAQVFLNYRYSRTARFYIQDNRNGN